MRNRAAFVMILAVGVTSAAAQQKDEKDVLRRRTYTQEMTWVTSADGNVTAPRAGQFHFIAAGPGAAKTIKNAPYSAEAVSEMVRVLADGTRITNTNVTFMARDKEGRTRVEHSIESIGPWVATGQQAPRFATIHDPVAKETYILNLNERTAQKVKMGEPLVFRSETNTEGGVRRLEEKVHVAVRSAAPGVAAVGAVMGEAMPMAGSTVMARRFDPKNSRTENLGKQTMEGVMVEGSRTTTTIPAGEIGNDRAIVSTSETWYSPELQMVIFSKTTDPQFGETTYRVTHLSRSEPGPEQFRIPAEFKISEPPAAEKLFLAPRVDKQE